MTVIWDSYSDTQSEMGSVRPHHLLSPAEGQTDSPNLITPKPLLEVLRPGLKSESQVCYLDSE
ncbi:hypothetical protein TorRG33x02_279760 [Trema orientale]|uniref:Uncharacterized protein n=1 Tax=Trema orientale TaxID=63057 RepID=A0A2P5CME5_TREOI|nr:hypothetical protein TorRG33x02_279760 [Trema orientale]